MENAAEALKMAGGVLLFLIALSVSIISFSHVRQAADTILEYKDRETEYIDSDYYYQVGINESEREVGLETILPTVSRVYTENYKIIFEGLNNPIYTVTKSREERFCLDGEFDNDIKGSGTAKEQSFLQAVVYGQKDTIFNDNYANKIRLPGTSLYTQLKQALDGGKKILEYGGRYYQDDEKTSSASGTGDNDNSNDEDEPETNKTRKRVITYRIL